MRIRLLVALSAFCFLVLIAAEAPSATAQTGTPSAATDPSHVAWTPRELQIKLLYSNAQYDCDELHDDLKRMLLELGARASDLNIDMAPCSQQVRDGDFLVKAAVKLSVLAPANATAENAASATLKGRWKTVELNLVKSPRSQVLTGSRLNHDSDGSTMADNPQLNFRARNMAILLRSQILPLFSTKSIDFKDGDTNVRVQVLAPG